MTEKGGEWKAARLHFLGNVGKDELDTKFLIW